MNERQKALSILCLGVSTMYGLYWLYNLFLARLLPIPSGFGAPIGLVLIYVVGYGLFLVITARSRSTRLPSQRQSRRLSGHGILLCILLQFTALAVFLALNIVMTILARLSGSPQPEEASMSMAPLDAVSLFLLTPVMEELVFRRAFAETLLPHGERFYVFSSAFSFAILHMIPFARSGAPLNGLPQLIYTFLLGLIWASVVVKTGDLRLSILLHILSNVCGQLMPLLAGIAAPLALVYLFFVMGAGLLGVLLLNHERRSGGGTIDGSTGILRRDVLRDSFGSVGLWLQIALVIVVVLIRAGGG
ncbi:MAG: CPBP family intramembrane metalloprotease [Bacillota bacterium]|nr:CPBP family intramembrane metalloprotease [Bacillota bacterium]